MNYFAYGSNLSVRRLHNRLQSVTIRCVVRLPAYKLIFHKKSVDGSAKCDALHTENRDDCVIGVLYEIQKTEKPILDRIEERGYGYEEKIVNVLTAQGKTIETLSYFAKKIDSSLKPYHWYKEHVLRGAREHHFPSAYIQMIEQIESIPDPMPERQVRELQIYC